MGIKEDNSDTGGSEVNSPDKNVQITNHKESSEINAVESTEDITEKINSRGIERQGPSNDEDSDTNTTEATANLTESGTSNDNEMEGNSNGISKDEDSKDKDSAEATAGITENGKSNDIEMECDSNGISKDEVLKENETNTSEASGIIFEKVNSNGIEMVDDSNGISKDEVSKDNDSNGISEEEESKDKDSETNTSEASGIIIEKVNSNDIEMVDDSIGISKDEVSKDNNSNGISEEEESKDKDSDATSKDKYTEDKMEHPEDECKSSKTKNKREQKDSVITSKYFKNKSGKKVSTSKKSKKSKPENDSLEMDESKDASQIDEVPWNGSNPRNVNELTKFCTKTNRDVSCFISSEVPDICKQQPCILGIDEAGRGPVLGPMVYGICYCPKSKEDDLKETGCADSKSLTEEKRETIFDKICKHSEYIGWEVEVISPKVISTSMLRRQKVSLNEVSHNSAIGLLRRALDAGALITEVFVDTVGPAEKYQAKLKGLFPELSITVAKKADSTFPIVGGASICAKVTRDVAIKSWTFSKIETSGEWGSGYPNDPVTKKFLTSTMDSVFGFPNIVRFSWSTAEKVLEDNAVQVDWEDDESGKATPSVKSFFSPGKEDQKQHRFFKDRCLRNVITL